MLDTGTNLRATTKAPRSSSPPHLSLQPWVMAHLMTSPIEGTMDPPAWISWTDLLFKLQHVSANQHIQYAVFHLTGTAQLWSICLTKDTPFSEGPTFARDIIFIFGLPISQHTLGDIAPPRQQGTLNDYIDFFTMSVWYDDIANELHQVCLFVNNLEDIL